jgi:phosphohistidine phosphatase SixA
MNPVSRMALLSVVVLALNAAPALAQDQVFFIVRHAERADAPPRATRHPMTPATGHPPMNGPDPALSPAGHARAKRLAYTLREAGVAQIVTTRYLRAKQTAAPLAQRLNLKPVTAPDNLGSLVDALRPERRTTLVIGHSNTVPQIVKGLGVATDVTVREQDYDDLFIVVRHESGAATLIRMKY